MKDEALSISAQLLMSWPFESLRYPFQLSFRIQLLSNTAAKGSGLFGNIRNILEIIQKYFWKIVKLCDKDLKFSDTQLCYNHSDSTVFLEKDQTNFTIILSPPNERDPWNLNLFAWRAVCIELISYSTLKN